MKSYSTTAESPASSKVTSTAAARATGEVTSAAKTSTSTTAVTSRPGHGTKRHGCDTNY
jgi:hypothetical protein